MKFRHCATPIIGAIVMLILVGCVQQQMEKWVGRHESELIGAFGPPAYTSDDGRGGRLLVYQDAVQFTTPGHSQTNSTAHGTFNEQFGSFNATGQSHTTYTPPQTNGYTRTRSFYVDENGYIYAFQWRGL